jgi:hypothetical protein
MPWHLEPKKDVAICDKPRGVDKRALIRGSPNGETPHDASAIVRLAPEYIGRGEGTRGSETSQYPQEENTTCDSVSSGERTRMRLNRSCVIPGRGCRVGVVGPFVGIYQSLSVMESCRRTGLKAGPEWV